MILYIGNNLKSKSANLTGVSTMSILLRREGYKVKVVSSIKNRLLRLISMLLSIPRYCIQSEYVLIDTYSTQNFVYAFLCSQLCRIFKLKYVAILRGGNLPERLVRSPKLCRMIFKNSFANVAPSNYLKIAFEEKGYPTAYIPNVIEIENYNYKAREVIEPKLLYVRSFSQIYNPQLAIEVLYELSLTYPEAKLCMIGPEKDDTLEKCKKLAISLGVIDKVEFTGRLTKKEWHKKSEDYDIFINTTNFDNTPVSVMEAMALGLPVVTTNVGGIPYLVTDGKDGLLVEKENKHQMLTAIQQLLKDKNKVSTLTSNARNKVESFDWNVVKNQWLELLAR